MNGDGSGWPVWLTLLLGAAGIVVAFVLISAIAPAAFDCGEASAKDCSEIVRNNGLAVAGVFAGLIGLLALHFNARRTHTDRLRLTNDTYVKAVEQLASNSMEVRIGGMYALERIAHEEQRYHWPVIETLSAYIRERAPWPPREKAATGLDAVAAAIVSAGGAVAERLSAPDTQYVASEETGEQAKAEEPSKAEKPERAPTDIQTALTIIGYRSKQWRERAPNWLRRQAPKVADRFREWQEQPLLRSLFAERWADAAVARLERVPTEPTRLEPRHVNLCDTNLERAELGHVYLMRAYLMRAFLMRAFLGGAHLEGASFNRAVLTNAILVGADLTAADLTDVDLAGALLIRASLISTDLDGADLRGAYLQDAILRGADLTGANLMGARFSRA